MKKLTHEILTHLQERQWDNLNPGDIAKSISIEAAELLEVFQWTNPSLTEFRKDKKKIEEIEGEVADVLIYCFELVALLGLDAEKIIRTKLLMVRKKYPAKLFQSMKVDSKEFKAAYLKIKNQHRAARAKKATKN